MTITKQSKRRTEQNKPMPKKKIWSEHPNADATDAIKIAEHPHVRLTVYLYHNSEESKISITESEIHPDDKFSLSFVDNIEGDENVQTLVQEAKDNVTKWCQKYAEKDHETFPLEMEISKAKSEFFTKFINELAAVPFGKAMSYKAMSLQVVKNDKSSRAIGNACNQNPFPLIVPCHRVLASKNKLGGFGCGVELKKELLNFENITYNV
jgi:O-6-methylguanine DNA methyltransferase